MMSKILVTIFLLTGVFLSVFLIIRGTSLFSKAFQEGEINIPQKVIITNISSTSFTLSYFTPSNKIKTKIYYGKAPQHLNLTKKDDRDTSAQGSEWFSHYVTIGGLEPDKEYYIKIEDFGEPINNNWIIQKTAPTLAHSQPFVKKFTGSVQRTARFGYVDTILYLKTEHGQLLSTRPNSQGKWEFDLSDLRTKDLQHYYQVLSFDVVDILAVVGNDGVGYLKTYSYGMDKPRFIVLNAIKLPFYGIELGSSENNSESSSQSATSKPAEQGVIQSIWLFITHFFGFN